MIVTGTVMLNLFTPAIRSLIQIWTKVDLRRSPIIRASVENPRLAPRLTTTSLRTRDVCRIPSVVRSGRMCLKWVYP